MALIIKILQDALKIKTIIPINMTKSLLGLQVAYFGTLPYFVKEFEGFIRYIHSILVFKIEKMMDS